MQTTALACFVGLDSSSFLSCAVCGQTSGPEKPSLPFDSGNYTASRWPPKGPKKTNRPPLSEFKKSLPQFGERDDNYVSTRHPDTSSTKVFSLTFAKRIPGDVLVNMPTTVRAVQDRTGRFKLMRTMVCRTYTPANPALLPAWIFLKTLAAIANSQGALRSTPRGDGQAASNSRSCRHSARA